ncbi:hypothetical protein DSAG12_04400 [Promethearchaeum syntrophicum]|uniref:Uncharacterized protein n=1 Tax=Promethearchaeum syntrophicum TaxID=2594042 RepID=A0AC61ZU31_9ARCH
MLSKTEREFLEGKKISPEYEAKMRNNIRKKLSKVSQDIELLLSNIDFCNSSRHCVDTPIPFYLKSIHDDIEGFEVQLEPEEVHVFGPAIILKNNWKLRKKVIIS